MLAKGSGARKSSEHHILFCEVFRSSFCLVLVEKTSLHVPAHAERRGEEEEVESMEKNPLEAEVRLIKMLFQSISAENHS